MEEQLTKYERASQLAQRILIMSRNSLLVNLRFMDVALSRLEYHPCEDSIIELATDGHYLLYHPSYILNAYKTESTFPTHAYLHMILHCVFQHMYVHSQVNQRYWDLACDIAVEYTISGLGLKTVSFLREPLIEQSLDELKGAGILFTAEKIYRHLLDQNLTPQKLAELRAVFRIDQHDPWYMTIEEKAKKYSLDSGGVGNSKVSDPSTSFSAASLVSQETDWKNISHQMQIDIEAFSKLQGKDPDRLIQNLLAVNREKYDYSSFLKKFAVRGEMMKLNDDEYDYIFYTYGLRLYKKVPLVEPLEYKDVKRIKDFVIAIDTSGSTSGELVQTFLQKTYNILKESESFFSKINVHIIQCDATIQEDAKITSQEEFDHYIKNMEIHGLGGTDFRPVFGYVQYLQDRKEFMNLKGLIYFTDGYGTFPEKKPDYETAFVFIQDNYNNPEVPPWAIRLVLQKDEI